jgi:hypothetical protein
MLVEVGTLQRVDEWLYTFVVYKLTIPVYIRVVKISTDQQMGGLS